MLGTPADYVVFGVVIAIPQVLWLLPERPPKGSTDDPSIAIAPGHTVEELVEHVIQGILRGVDVGLLEHEVKLAFGLSDHDAALALDRVQGGVVRASTGNRANCPSRKKDPLAWTSFRRASRDRALIAAFDRYCEARRAGPPQDDAGI
jgi:hypothetical protein